MRGPSATILAAWSMDLKHLIPTPVYTEFKHQLPFSKQYENTDFRRPLLDGHEYFSKTYFFEKKESAAFESWKHLRASEDMNMSIGRHKLKTI